jgi:hypothetical protein
VHARSRNAHHGHQKSTKSSIVQKDTIYDGEGPCGNGSTSTIRQSGGEIARNARALATHRGVGAGTRLGPRRRWSSRGRRRCRRRWELSKRAHRPCPGRSWRSEHATSDRGGASKGGGGHGSMSFVTKKGRRKRISMMDAEHMRTPFTRISCTRPKQPDRRMDVYNEVAKRVKGLVPKDAAPYTRGRTAVAPCGNSRY